MADAALIALSRALGLGDDPNAVLETLAGLYREVDEEVALRASSCNLPCRMGCDACCREAVFVSAPEVLMVAQAIFEGYTREDRRALLDQMDRIAERFEDELELLESIDPGDERDEVAARVKFVCPLLTQEGTCSVYEARELNARTFGATWDEKLGAPYGCGLTHERLAMLPRSAATGLYGARHARRLLAERLPRTERVHVYPWWFSRYRAHFE